MAARNSRHCPKHKGACNDPRRLSTAFLVLFFVLLYHLLLIIAPFLTPILWALLLARLFYPVYEWLCARLRGRGTWAALLTTVVVTVLAVLPIVYVGILAVTETIHAYQKAMTWIHAGGLRTLPQYVRPVTHARARSIKISSASRI